MNKKGNRGYQDTDRRICDYVLQKIETTPLHEITVQSVCRDLDINRSTFYVHFQDIYAVAETIADEYNTQFIERCSRLAESGNTVPKDFLLAVLEHVEERKVFYLNLFSDDLSIIREKDILELRKLMAEPLMRSYHVKESWMPYYFTYVMNGFFAITELWLKGGCSESPEDIAEIMFNLNPDFERYWKIP